MVVKVILGVVICLMVGLFVKFINKIEWLIVFVWWKFFIKYFVFLNVILMVVKIMVNFFLLFNMLVCLVICVVNFLWGKLDVEKIGNFWLWIKVFKWLIVEIFVWMNLLG